MKRLFKATVLLLVLLMGLGCVSVFASNGKNGIFDFYEGMPPTQTKKYDVTGDGKKDTVSYEWDEVNMQQILKVNGKRINNWDFYKGKWAWVTIVKVGSKDFLELEIDDWRALSLKCGLYQVKNNKLKKILDYSSLFNKKTLLQNDFADTGTECSYLEARKVKGDTIYFGGTLATKSVGQVNFDGLKVKYKNGKFTVSTAAAKAVSAPRDKDGQLVSYFTAKKKITAYKEAGSSAKAFTIAKGKQFKITKMKVLNKQIYLRVRTKAGKLGWIKSGKAQLVTVRTPYVEE
ncbi:MAG: hypothetical protein IJ121_04100 [Eubacterium sp.]|nr:hypothetical protein [Eubacterium sp.]